MGGSGPRGGKKNDDDVVYCYIGLPVLDIYIYIFISFVIYQSVEYIVLGYIAE